jgi:single-strand DNA-binding protein
MNTATVIGRAGQDAEIRYFESGKVKASFSLAVKRWDSKTKENVTDWFNIEVWDKQAEFAGDFVKKVVKLLLMEEFLLANGTMLLAKLEKDS